MKKRKKKRSYEFKAWRFVLAILGILLIASLYLLSFTVNNGGLKSNAYDSSAIIGEDTVKGSENAPITIVEFSDYACGYCRLFYEQTLPLLEEFYIKTGTVKFVHKDFPLQTTKPAEAAECAGEQGKFYEMHDVLFEQGLGGTDAYKKYAADIGLNMTAFNECLDNGEMTAEVMEDRAQGLSYGVQGTPTFLINDKLLVGARPFNQFQEIIEAELSA